MEAIKYYDNINDIYNDFINVAMPIKKDSEGAKWCSGTDLIDRILRYEPGENLYVNPESYVIHEEWIDFDRFNVMRLLTNGTLRDSTQNYLVFFDLNRIPNKVRHTFRGGSRLYEMFNSTDGAHSFEFHVDHIKKVLEEVNIELSKGEKDLTVQNEQSEGLSDNLEDVYGEYAVIDLFASKFIFKKGFSCYVRLFPDRKSFRFSEFDHKDHHKYREATNEEIMAYEATMKDSPSAFEVTETSSTRRSDIELEEITFRKSYIPKRNH